jgi:hypothetical protein
LRVAAGHSSGNYRYTLPNFSEKTSQWISHARTNFFKDVDTYFSFKTLILLQMSVAKFIIGSLAVTAGTVGLLVVRIFMRKRSSPNKPLFMCFLDASCEIFSLLKVGPWGKPNDIHHAMEVAVKETGLTDFGIEKYGSDFIRFYEVLRKTGLEKSKARYSPMGYYIAGSSLKRRMASRLKMIDYLKKHPQVEKIQLKSPIFVVGFTRTGTTFLHEMLGLHEKVRMHYSWEQMDPTPTTDDESIEALTASAKIKYEKNKKLFDFLLKQTISPRLHDIHRVGYDEPEECTTPCSIELPWNIYELPFNPFALEEVAKLGAGSAFPLYRKFLQMLTFSASDRRDQDFTWMLKCPFHLPYLDALHKEFPDATLVWTHRNPSECIASACSLFETLMQMGMEDSSCDRKRIGKAMMEYTHCSLRLAEETIQRLGSKFKILHIRYAETIKAPKETCRKVFEKVMHRVCAMCVCCVCSVCVVCVCDCVCVSLCVSL